MASLVERGIFGQAAAKLERDYLDDPIRVMFPVTCALYNFCENRSLLKSEDGEIVAFLTAIFITAHLDVGTSLLRFPFRYLVCLGTAIREKRRQKAV